MMIKKGCIVIGSGPAGLMAAYQAGANSCLIEKKNQLSKKLRISGSSQCNFTHTGDEKEFLLAYGKAKNWLKHAIYSLPNKKLIDFFSENGMESIIRDDGKVFPKSLKSISVTNVFENLLKNNEILKNTDVLSIHKEQEYFHLKTDNGNFKTKYLVLATGGMSFPQTGSDGKGFELAKSLGHKIITTKPALTTIVPQNYQFTNLAGISIKNVNIKKGKHEFCGDLLFAHNWLSGPVIIDNAHNFSTNDKLMINFLSIDESELTSEIKKNRQLKNYLRTTNITKRMANMLFSKNILEKNYDNLSKNELQMITNKLLNYQINIKKINGFQTAMATAGGVSLKEVNSKTMESRICKNLFFAGEILDFVGISGGYNITAAFATGYLAGTIIKNLEL